MRITPAGLPEPERWIEMLWGAILCNAQAGTVIYLIPVKLWFIRRGQSGTSDGISDLAGRRLME